jgi:hypothetical protein
VDDDVIPATTHRKAGLDQEGPSPHEGEQTHLAGSGVHTASGLIAYFPVIFHMQSRNQWYCVLPPIFCLETFAGIYWGRQKKQVERLFFCNGIIRFDFALHMMSFPYCIFFLHVSFIKKKIKIKIWGGCSRLVPSKVCQLSHVFYLYY